MCGISKRTKVFEIHFSFTDTKIEACEKCSLREVYGRTPKNNKRYIRDKEEGRI